MNNYQKTKIIKHLHKFFHDEPTYIISQTDKNDFPITILLFEPNKDLPFWKFCTLGASNYKMENSTNKNLFNEYVMFVDKDEDLENNIQLRNWYMDMLSIPARFPFETKNFLSYGHDIFIYSSNEEMVGVALLLPEIIPDSRFLTCRINPFKKIYFFQVMPMTSIEKDILYNEGFKIFEKLFYPDNSDNFRPFAQQHRVFKDL